MLELPLTAPAAPRAVSDMSQIMRTISAASARPRYTYMVLDLISRVAGPGGAAGPHVREGERLVPIREWLAGAIAPSASRHHLRKATIAEVRRELAGRGLLPPDRAEAERVVQAEVADRILASGMTAVSRAVSELVRAGLIRRHYQGYRVDHANRGAQRLAVYTVPADIMAALERRPAA